MADQTTPADRQQAPDPSHSYERSHPGREAGLGSLDSPIGQATPANQPDGVGQAVANKQDPKGQVNAQELGDSRSTGHPVRGPHGGATAGGNAPLPGKAPDASMKDETPLGWDQAPTDISNPREQRHPRTEGKGGTP